MRANILKKKSSIFYFKPHLISLNQTLFNFCNSGSSLREQEYLIGMTFPPSSGFSRVKNNVTLRPDV